MREPRKDLWRRFWEQNFGLGMAILLAILTVLCYRFALALPFFHDDLPIMTWLQQYGWRDIWFSQENGYYRPLAFTIYKMGTWLPLGMRQVALHAVNVVLLWASGLLAALLVRRSTGERGRAGLAGVLLVVFPFLVEGIPWITALSHPQVLALTLLGAYAALRADDEGKVIWWAISLTATAMAPLAHESGAMAGVIVGGFWLLTRGFRPQMGRRLALTGAGVALNVAAVGARVFIPGAHTVAQMQGLQDLPQNGMYFLQGLLYPVAPFVQSLVQSQGWHDFTLLGIGVGVIALLIGVLLRLGSDRRWVLGSLWWWACGALPAAASLRYGGLFVGARLYTLASAGVVIFWAGLIIELGKRMRPGGLGKILAGVMALLLIGQNVAYLRHARRLYVMLDTVYDDVLAAIREEAEGSLGFVNVPSALKWDQRVYPLVTDNVVFVPDEYSNLSEFVHVNVGWREVQAATYGPITQITDPAWLGQGPWLEEEAVRAFALEHRALWVARYDEPQAGFLLDRVGQLHAGQTTAQPLDGVHYTDGPILLSAEPAREESGRWAVALDWQARGPVPATVFLHVLDPSGQLVAQADGPALGGLLPLSQWQAGDRIRDLRYVTLPVDGEGPYTVHVGLYNEQGRFPAWVDGERSPDDAPQVGILVP